jgi:hypothetical protein
MTENPVPGSTRPIWHFIIIFVLILVVNVLFARYGELAKPVTNGMPGLYLAVAFMIPFALWFRGWGVLAAYLGCMIGSTIAPFLGLIDNAVFSVADLLQALIPAVVFAFTSADPALRSPRDWAYFLAFAVLVATLAGAVWGAYTLAFFGIVSWGSAYLTGVSWFLSDMIVIIFITTPLLYLATPALRARGLLAERSWWR